MVELGHDRKPAVRRPIGARGGPAPRRGYAPHVPQVRRRGRQQRIPRPPDLARRDRLEREAIGLGDPFLEPVAGQGATRILALAPDMPWEWTGRSVATYQTWCARQGREPYVVQVPLPDRMSATNVTAAAQHAALRVLRHDPPDAILALCLGFAPGVLAAARELGLRVPRDLLLAQDADEPPLRTTDPPVTAVELFPEDQARAAVTMLIDLLRGERPASTKTTGVELRPRPSSERGS